MSQNYIKPESINFINQIYAVGRYISKLTLLIIICYSIIGCGRPAGIIFEPLPQPLAWPPPPDASRIFYVGQLKNELDLKPPVSFSKALHQTFWGKDQPRTMLSPFAVCSDNADQLFVADSNGKVVHVFNFNTRQYKTITPPPNADNTPAFQMPVGITYDNLSQRLFVSDSMASIIYVFDQQGNYLYKLQNQMMLRPSGLAFNQNQNWLVVADTPSHRILAISPDTGELRWVIGKRGTKAGEFNFPTNVAYDLQGRLYVSDTLNFRVQQFDKDLKPIRQFGSKGDLPGYLSRPKGIALDTDNHLYIVDAHFEAIQVFDANTGALLLAFGSEGTEPGEFWLPAGIYIDKNNRIWIADVYNTRIQVFDYKKPVEELIK